MNRLKLLGFHKNVACRILFVLVTCASISLSQAENLNSLNTECFKQNKGRSCVRLGTTLWQTPQKRDEARAAFAKGCELKIESACTLKDLNKESGTAAEVARDSKPESSPVGIEKTGPLNYKVSRQAAVKYAGDLENTLSTAKMVLNVNKKGETQGYRFKSIEKGSVFAALGFQQNDVITHVNDQKIASPGDAMSLLPTLLYGATDEYAVRVVRGGQNLTQQYEIQ